MRSFKGMLGEISAKTLKSYSNKAAQDKHINRTPGLALAYRKMKGKANVVPATNEELELDEMKIVPGSVDHMSHAVHNHHFGSTDPSNSHYHIHNMGTERSPVDGNPTIATHYMVHHKMRTEGDYNSHNYEAHHFSLSYGKNGKADVHHHGQVGFKA